MVFTKRATRKLISTWPQRLAISGFFAFIVWTFTEENLMIFFSVVLVLHALLTYFSARIREPKQRFNEELKY